MVPLLLLALLFAFPNWGLSWDYGNGRHGSYVLTSSTTIEQLYQTVRLTNDPAQYNPFDSNAIPNFQNLIITNGATLTANAWNGSIGGRIVLKVQATMSVASSSAISVSGIGYRGGGSSQQGESYAGGQNSSTSANYGGGGGGIELGYENGALYYLAGGGGGYGANGANGTLSVYGYNFTGGYGGSSYGDPTLETNYLGSGGGGGVQSGGGNGGGAIEIEAGQLLNVGQIQANGNGGGTSYYYSDAGGGSGGSILLRVASAVLGTNNLSATGGGAQGGAGNGGAGRILIGYAEYFTGISTPTAYTLLDTNSDNVTVISPQPVSQTNVLGANVSFKVGVYGLPTLFLQWNFNNAPIPGATNQTLVLPNIALTNTGTYTLTISNAVMTVVSSNAFLKVLDTAIPLNDGIPNWWKEEYGLSTNDPTLATNYPPADSQLTYLEKYLYGLNPLTNDTDGDGLTDYAEIFVYHTNPLSANTAGDAIPDGWKVEYGLNPLVADANNVAGFDGVTYLQVYQYDLTHTNQLNPNTPFSVGSGLSNFEIINNGQHTNNFYYDHEDRLLGMETSRGVSIGYQYDGNGNLLQQAVLSRASETNGLPVLWLWLNGLTNNPGIAYQDSSGNGWDNYQEWLAGLNPNSSNSVPNSAVNPGTNIASLTLPFTPNNFVVSASNLNGLPGDEIVVGADGNPGTNNNSLFVLTQTATNWSTQQITVGSFGITSIAVGQPTNQPSAGIYVGLRGTNGNGQVMEFISNSGIWQSNLITVSSNEPAFVGGVRQNGDLLVELGTNGLSGSLWSVTFTNGVWSQSLLSSNVSHQGLPSHGLVLSQTLNDSSLRLLNTNSIEVISTNQLIVNEPNTTTPIVWRGLQLATGMNRPGTNQTDLFYCGVNDNDGSGTIDAGDAFVFAEYQISNAAATTLSLTNIPVGSNVLAQSYALSSVDFLGSGMDYVFTAEPNGAIYSWSASDNSSPLQRQLFSPDYLGNAWHGITAVKMPASGQGLVGLLVSPTNQNTCQVIFWQPQAVLPTPQTSTLETAPFAAILPSSNSLGSNAVVTVRLWDNEGDASTPFLQFQILGATNWQNATLTSLDGSSYSSAVRVAAFPGGSDHVTTWNALADVGANVVTNILLRASAQDFMLTGNWSSPTPFQLNTTVATNPIQTNAPVNFTGITPVQGGIRFNWQGGSNEWLYLQRSPTLAGTNVLWINIWTGAPPALNFGSYTDFFGTNPMEFYRFKVVTP